MDAINIPWKTYYFYKNRLSPREKRIYERMYEGVSRFETQIHLHETCTLDEISRIYTLLRLDCPLFFQLSHSIRVWEGKNAMFHPEYLMDRKKYMQLYGQVVDFVRSSLKTMHGVSVYKQVKCIHNSIARHVIYHGVEEENSHNVLGAILYRKAVCESIAMAFKLICDGNHIPCITVFGHAASTDGKNFGEVEDDGKDNHAWNKVCIGKVWYNVDVTFDLGIDDPADKNSLKYGYFCRSDRVFSPDHRASFPGLPVATEDHSYYRSVGLYAADEAQLLHLVEDRIRLGQLLFTFEYAPGLQVDWIRKTIANYLGNTPYPSITSWNRESLRLLTVRFNTDE